MFGGTKGKFNGLDLLDDIQNTNGPSRRNTGFTLDDRVDYDDDYDYEDDYDGNDNYSYDKDTNNMSNGGISARPRASVAPRGKFNGLDLLEDVQNNRDPNRNISGRNRQDGQAIKGRKQRYGISPRIKGKWYIVSL